MKSIEIETQGIIRNFTMDFPEYCRGCKRSDIDVELIKSQDIMGANIYDIEISCLNKRICDMWNN